MQVYELTARGEQLRPLLGGLALWGWSSCPTRWASGRCARRGRGLHARGRAGRAARRLRGTFAFEVEGEEFHVAADGDELVVRDGPPPPRPTCG